MLYQEEIKRYNRHIILPEVGPEGQEKLKAAKIIVIGAGGLGCPVLQYLAAVGIGTIGIVDNDIVSESNLQRQILFGTGDIGKLKAETAAKKLSRQNPFIKINFFNERLSKDNALNLLSEYDIIIDGSDNIPSRLLINDACIILNKPFVYGAIYKFVGQVSVFNFNNGPTYRCLFPEPPTKDEIPNCSTIGVIGVIPGITGLYQANEVIKIILNKGNILSGKLFQIDALSSKTEIISFKRTSIPDSIKELGEYGEICESDQEKVKINSISPGELKIFIDKNEDIEIFDLRSQKIFDSFNLGGKCIDTEKLLFDQNLLPKNKKVIILCEIGEKSLAVTKYLQINKNITNVYNLEGGLQAWIDLGYNINTKS